MPKTLKNLTPSERDTSLLLLAAMGGHSTRAAAALREQGIVVSSRTLRRWRDSDRYRELAQQHSHEIESVAVQQTRDFLISAGHVERQALEQTEKDIAAGIVKDASTAMRNISVAKGIAVDKLLTLTGRPQAIVQHGDSFEAILERLQAKHPNMFATEGSGEEVTDAEVVEQADLITRQLERRRGED